MTQNTTQLLLVYIYIDILVHNTAYTPQKDDIKNTYIKIYECRYHKHNMIIHIIIVHKTTHTETDC